MSDLTGGERSRARAFTQRLTARTHAGRREPPRGAPRRPTRRPSPVLVAEAVAGRDRHQRVLDGTGSQRSLDRRYRADIGLVFAPQQRKADELRGEAIAYFGQSRELPREGSGIVERHHVADIRD